MTNTVKNVVDNGVDSMFNDLVKEYNLKHGDITPHQVIELDKLKNNLMELLNDWVYDNLPVESEL